MKNSEVKYPEVAQRLSLALSLAGMKPQELADLSGVNKSSISQYMNGSHAPSNLSAGKMAGVLGVNPVWLMGLPVPKDLIQEKETNVKIKVLGNVAAGIPIQMITNVIGYEEIPQSLAKTGKFFGLKIKGDSMSPIFLDGDIVIVRQQPDAESGEMVIATVGDSEATCKRLRKHKDGIELISNNPSYDSYDFTAEAVDSLPVNIIGKVIELRRRF